MSVTAPPSASAWAGVKSSMDTMQVNRPLMMRNIKLTDGTTDPVTGEYNITEEIGDAILINANPGGMVVLPLSGTRFIPFGELIGFGPYEKL